MLFRSYTAFVVLFPLLQEDFGGRICFAGVASAFSPIRHGISWKATQSATFLAATTTAITASNLEICERVGSGSYGTVHRCRLLLDETNNNDDVICKRAWTRDELSDQDNPQEREERCKYYFAVEQHCFDKMEAHPQLPPYHGTLLDDDGRSWMAFGHIQTKHNNNETAPTLCDVMQLEWKEQHHANDGDERHHLYRVQKALGMSEAASFADTLDTVMESLLTVLSHVHAQGIVHRDIKPGNLLCDANSQSLVLIDFGSAADLEPVKSNFWGGSKRVGLEERDRVAVSPIYSAPEVFVRPDRAPFQFDVFSAALIVFQLIFNFLDERMDAGFHQQLQDANCDLDTWLSKELSSKVRPVGLQEALEYLSSRQGLWRLLGDMLRKDPEQRISSAVALEKFRQIILRAAGEEGTEDDGPFFETVVARMRVCEIPPEGPAMGPRPLHYVATFRRNVPLGLLLAEADQPVEDVRWTEATQDAAPGEVFIEGIVPGSQASQIGTFEIGDRLQGIGELPLANGGFEKVVEMLEQQPARTKYVKLHFDRRSARETVLDKVEPPSHVRVVEQGAWSARGRRKAQEDSFVLQEIQNGKNNILLAAVFDGHGGTAASHAAKEMVPFLFSEQLRQSGSVRQALESAWEDACTTYRSGCVLGEECLAEYDPREGTLQANTGSQSLVAGTTASIVAVQEGQVTVLNCGDSRSLLVSKNGQVVFATQDHTPEAEMDRFLRGKEQGYSIPVCSLSRWFVPVGDYEYAVSRSLEGPFATSKGLISEPDVTSISSVPGTLILASDGLFEVMDNGEIGRDVLDFKTEGLSADEAARKLCAMALEKGSSDNVSVVVVYLE